MDLGGRWAAAKAERLLQRDFAQPGFDDRSWERIVVPEGNVAVADGPVLYRRRFEARLEGEGRRAFIVVEGVLSQSDVWLDGSYVGDTDSYFFPHSFEVTAALRERGEHLLALEVSPGGIWAPVHLDTTGPVRLSKLRLACVEANPSRAVLDLWAVLDSRDAGDIELLTEVRRSGHLAAAGARRLHLASGANRARWRVEVPDPELWWPAGHGPQPLYEVSVSAKAAGEESDSRVLRTGLRQVRARAMVFSVNGEKLFLLGADLDRDRTCLDREGGLNLFRVKGHVGRPTLYDSADEAGLLLWQDLPTRQRAGDAVWLLSHHPSVAVWCAGEPSGGVAGAAARRAAERADPSRPALARPQPYPYECLVRSALGSPSPAGAAQRLARLGTVWPAALRFFAGLAAPASSENLRAVTEGLRRLRLRPTGGFTVAAGDVAAGAFAPLLVVASWPRPTYRPGARASFSLHVVSDLTVDASDLVLEARLTWPGGGRAWRFAGSAPASRCTFVGEVVAALPRELAGLPPWPVRLVLVLSRAGEVVSRNYYEAKLG